MPSKKKRASYSLGPHIAVQAVVEQLENDDASSSHQPVVQAPSEPLRTSSEEVSVSAQDPEFSIEALLSEESEHDKAIKNRAIWTYRIGVIGALFISLSALVVWVLHVRLSPQTSTKQSVIVSQTPTPTKEPESVSRASLSFIVLNGSGVSGKAAKSAALLEEKGYVIAETGNAKKIAQSTLSVSQAVSKEARLLLLSDVELLFGVGTISSEFASSTISARLILGAK